MKKNFKFFLASAMAMVMTVSLLPASVLAATVNFYGSGYADPYRVNADTNVYLVCEDTDLADMIPSAYQVDADAYIGEREGYTFGGWFLDEDYQNLLDLNINPYLVTKDTVLNLYAKWDKDNSGDDDESGKDPVPTAPTITFNANGGTGTMEPITATKKNEEGKWIVVLPECGFTAPEGKFFDCWSFDLSVVWNSAKPGNERVLTESITAYAVWGNNVHTVTFWDVAYEKPYEVEVPHGEKLELPTYEELFDTLPANTWFISWQPDNWDMQFDNPVPGDSFVIDSEEIFTPVTGTVNIHPDGLIVDSKGNAVTVNGDVKADFTNGKLGLELVNCQNYTDANVDHWNVYKKTVDYDNYDESAAAIPYVYELISEKEGIDLPEHCVYVQAVLKASASSGNGDVGGGGGGGSSDDSNSSSDRVTNEDGSVTTTTTNKDGSVTEKTTYADGSKSEITVNKDGSAEFKAEMKDGTTATATIAADGKVEAEVELSNKATLEAARNNEVLPLPIPSVPVTTDRDEASVITVSASDSYATKVEVPVEDVTPGTVVILVDKDGKETIVTKSSVTKDGVVFQVKGDVTVKIVDNSKSFGDVKSNFWGNNSVAFVTSRELFSGTSPDSFSPNEPMTRAMIFTVLARLDGQDPTGGANWWDKGMDWAKSVGLTDGSNPQAQLTREQLAVMLYNYSGKPAVDTSKLDKAGVSSWAENAMAWCVSQGVMAGDQNGNLNAGSNATRAEVATMLMSFVSSNNR